ncbi:MAG: hypothetical protein ACM3SQ_17065 [Betaproteobacteria bacterium]
MKPRICTLVATAAALVVAAAVVPLNAQSLADVARKEEARRKQIKEHAKVITDKDLKAVPAAAPQPEAARPATAAPAAAAPDASKDKDKSDEPVKDQAYWSKRMKDLKQALDRDQTYLDGLQSRINALTTDFTARDDPAQRAVIEQERKKVLAEFDRLKAQIEADKKAIADLEEEARRAGVPPGWLRS